jgi:hypothetical protein
LADWRYILIQHAQARHPDDNQADANLIDFKDYLCRRVDLTEHVRSASESEVADWKFYGMLNMPMGSGGASAAMI